MFQNKPGKGKRLIQFALAAAILLPACAAYAEDVDYTFSGTGSGTINGAAFTDAAFTVSFDLDPSTISSGGGYYYYYNVGGTFTEGSNVETLPDVTIVLNANPNNDPPNAYETLLIFNGADPGDDFGFQSLSSLDGYDLTAPFTTGVVNAAGNLETYDDGSGFASSGGQIDVTGLDSLEFTAAAPEPPPAVLLLTGLLCLFGAGLLRRTVRA